MNRATPNGRGARIIALPARPRLRRRLAALRAGFHAALRAFRAQTIKR